MAGRYLVGIEEKETDWTVPRSLSVSATKTGSPCLRTQVAAVTIRRRRRSAAGGAATRERLPRRPVRPAARFAMPELATVMARASDSRAYCATSRRRSRGGIPAVGHASPGIGRLLAQVRAAAVRPLLRARRARSTGRLFATCSRWTAGREGSRGSPAPAVSQSTLTPVAGGRAPTQESSRYTSVPRGAPSNTPTLGLSSAARHQSHIRYERNRGRTLEGVRVWRIASRVRGRR